MSFWLLIVHLAGAATLLIWAVRMVRTGVERAHGAALRRALRGLAGGKVQAAGIGAVLAILLQSATAVGMLAAGFAASGMLGLPTGLAILLGADLGSAIVVQILSFDLSWLTPFLLIAGGWMFLKSPNRTVRQDGRVLMGIALILVSLSMIGEATEPLRESEFLPVVVGYLQADFVTAFLIAALFTWLIHSSVAAILLVMTLAAQGLIPVELGLSLMLGANLGGGLIAFMLTRGDVPAARRIPTGNLIFRGAGAVVALILVNKFTLPLDMAGGTVARQVVNLHLLFNLALVVFCLPLAGIVADLVERMIPDAAVESEADDPMLNRVSALDRSVLDTPRLALASATRELLRMAEIIEVMLRPVMDIYESGDAGQIKRVRRLDQEVDKAHSEIKHYLAEFNRGALEEVEAARSMELTGFAINLEAAGDIIARTLMQLAEDKRKNNLKFSKEGWRELTDLHDRVMANTQLALSVLVSGDHDTARQLVEEKERMRELERESHDRHLRRLQEGAKATVKTSDIHLETVRSLKQINSLLATVAYPILIETGDLLESRLSNSDQD